MLRTSALCLPKKILKAQPKHMFWVLRRTVIRAPKHRLKLMGKKIFYAQKLVCPWTIYSNCAGNLNSSDIMLKNEKKSC